MSWYFLFFLVSGFCSILYEIVWLRLSMAQFGVTSALVAIVLSMIHGWTWAWAHGVADIWCAAMASKPVFSAFSTLYAALAELLIGISALLVPLQLQWGRALLETTGLPSSGAYYLASGAWIAGTLIPWCAFMGSNLPSWRWPRSKNTFQDKSSSSFSFLYLANVVGATGGAIIPLLLIELYGFRGTLIVGAAR